MKLFQRLLVAPAAFGLLAPLAVNANEVNLNEISNYSDVDFEIDTNSFSTKLTTNPLLAGGEGMMDSHDHDSDSFSSTTSASFSVDMAIGALDGASISTGDGNVAPERVEARYGYQIDLTTSFTGEDSLDVSIDAGNGGGALSEFDMNSGGDSLAVDGVAYTFPLGEKTTVFFGDNMDGSTLYSTACAYGGPSNTLDDCGNVNSAITGGGTAFGASFDIGSGFTGAIGYAGAGSSTSGLLTKQGDDSYGGQLTYTADSYGASVTYANVESSGADTTSWALNGYWTPSTSGSMPSVSVGYEMDDPETSGAKDKTSYFIGLQWDLSLIHI